MRYVLASRLSHVIRPYRRLNAFALPDTGGGWRERSKPEFTGMKGMKGIPFIPVNIALDCIDFHN
jgi:hypothetical protein